ncbi:MAG: DnaD domain protein [Anaerovorax sp.]
MSFKREPIKDYYLRDTHVENIFINEYMVGAPGDYVKVYLFALMYAGHNIVMDSDIIAKQMNMDIEDVLKAWSYWEKLGVVKKHFENPKDVLHYEIEFLNLKERNYGKKQSQKETSASDKIHDLLEDKEIKAMYGEIERIKGKRFDGKEPSEILSWITDHNATTEVIVYAYLYCMKTKKQSNYKYVGVVVKEWAGKGMRTIDQVEAYLAENDNRHYLYKRILKSLGFMRNATEAEKVIMDSWLDDLGFSIEKILEACGKTTGISNPNLNYVNSVLKGWDNESKGITKSRKNYGEEGKPNQIAKVFKYYEQIKVKNEEAAENRRMEVYSKIPKIKDLEEEARVLGLKISKIMIAGPYDAKPKIKELKDKIDEINSEKAYLLTENNFKIDYMDIRYSCPLCNDTGLQDTGERCTCFTSRLADMEKMV